MFVCLPHVLLSLFRPEAGLANIVGVHNVPKVRNYKNNDDGIISFANRSLKDICPVAIGIFLLWPCGHSCTVVLIN